VGCVDGDDPPWLSCTDQDDLPWLGCSDGCGPREKIDLWILLRCVSLKDRLSWCESGCDTDCGWSVLYDAIVVRGDSPSFVLPGNHESSSICIIADLLGTLLSSKISESRQQI
jgi:hypothetical protein